MIEVEEDIIVYAVRYALGRQSYSVYDVIVTLDKTWKNLSHRTKFVILRDIQDFLKNNTDFPGDIYDCWSKAYEKLSSKYPYPIV